MQRSSRCAATCTAAAQWLLAACMSQAGTSATARVSCAAVCMGSHTLTEHEVMAPNTHARPDSSASCARRRASRCAHPFHRHEIGCTCLALAGATAQQAVDRWRLPTWFLPLDQEQDREELAERDGDDLHDVTGSYRQMVSATAESPAGSVAVGCRRAAVTFAGYAGSACNS